MPEHKQELLTGYVQHVWAMQDGLPDASIQAIAQTPDHNLWVGTEGGLLRFNGHDFTLFNRENTPAFHVSGIAALMVSRSGDLWIGTAGGGLIRYHEGTFSHFFGDHGFSGDFVRALLEDRNGRIWIGTYDGLYRFENGQISSVSIAARIPKLVVFSLFQDHDGAIWVGGSTLLRLTDTTEDVFSFPGAANQAAIKSLMETADNTLLIGTTAGLFRTKVQRDTHQASFTRVPGIDETVRVIHAMPDGRIWLGTINEGIFSYDRGDVRQLVMQVRLPSAVILSIFNDLEGNIWLGTQGGLVRFSRSAILPVNLPGSPQSDIQTIYADPTGPLWVSSRSLFQLNGDSAKSANLTGLEHVRTRQVFREHSGGLWVGTDGEGVFHLARGVITHYTTQNNLTDNFIRAIAEADDGSIWIGTGEGLNRWRDGKLEKVAGGNQNSLAPVGIHTITGDSHGDIWVGADQGLFHWKAGQFVENSLTQALRQKSVWAIYEDKDRVLWIGTIGDGLARWDGRQVQWVTTANGLLSNKIFAILEDPHDTFWMSGPTGVTAVTRSQLNAAAGDSHDRATPVFYNASNGLVNTQLLGGTQPAGAIAHDGSIWFPSISGPVHVVPEVATRNSPLPVLVEQVIADGLVLPSSPTIDLNTSGSRLEIHYGAIELLPQTDLRFRYKLDGFDSQWINAGTSRVAYYTNLPAKHYRFLVSVFNVSAPDVVSTTEIDIFRRPRFYHTIWFYLLCIAVIAAIAVAVHMARTRRLQATFHAVLAERARLAREMHDTLIQGCTSISSLLEALHTTSACTTEAGQSLLDSARIQASTTIEEARQAVWGLRHDDVANVDAAHLLMEIAEQTQKQFSLPVNCVVTGKSISLHPAVSHHLLMSTREALYNAARHGNPSAIQLRVRFAKGSVEVEVEDDGKGFVWEGKLKQNQGKVHYGLIGIMERLKGIDGQVSVQTAPGRGTRIMMTVPHHQTILERLASNDAPANTQNPRS